MKIKRYIASSMRAALAQVRSEQGADAVILSSRKVEEGLEVIAAIDYDEALFIGATGRRPGAPASVQPAAFDAPPTTVAAPAAAVAPPVSAPVAAADATSAAVADGGYLAVRRELAELRELMQSDKRLREPLQTQVLDLLTAMDFSPDVAASLAAQTPRRTRVTDPSRIPLALLLRQLLVVEKLAPLTSGVVAMIGPTGAGKTTTIAKLAARWSMQHGSQHLALVSTDSYRVGAREQLATYARLLGAPMHVATSGEELSQLLERLKHKKLVLIDTAGVGPRDARLKEQLAALRLGAARASVLLALPAQGDAHALDQVVRSFAPIAPAACVLTKVDEAASLGAVLSTTLRHNLRIAFVCDGQRVPQDLYAAHERRVWLVRAALDLKQRASPSTNDAAARRTLARARLHA